MKLHQYFLIIVSLIFFSSLAVGSATHNVFSTANAVKLTTSQNILDQVGLLREASKSQLVPNKNMVQALRYERVSFHLKQSERLAESGLTDLSKKHLTYAEEIMKLPVKDSSYTIGTITYN